MLDAAKAAHAATLHYVRAPVGRLATPLHTYLAMIADDPTVELVNEAQRAYAAPLAAARADLASLPILSASAPFKCGGRGGPDFYTDVARGSDRDQGRGRHLSVSEQPEGGEGRRRHARGNGSSDRRRFSAAIDPALRDEQPLLGPAFACYNFDVIDGVQYAIDVTSPPATTIRARSSRHRRAASAV